MGLLALLWGSSFVWIEIALTGLSPVQISVARCVLGAVVLVVLCYSAGQRLPRSARAWGHMTLAAVFANAVPFTLFGLGQQTVDSGVAGVINATTPLWALVIGVAIGADRGMGPVRLAGLLLGFGGTVLIFAPWQAGLAGAGALAILAAAISYAVAYAYIDRTMRGRGVAPIAMSATQLVAAAGLTALALPFGGPLPTAAPTWPVLVAIGVLGVFGTGFAFALYYRLLADEGPTNAAVVGYLLPVVSVLLGALFLAEELNGRIVAGMAVVLLGVAMTRITRRPKAATVVVEPRLTPGGDPMPTATVRSG
ncbi:DMT family transporter [Actinokineospora sp. 24-640]